MARLCLGIAVGASACGGNGLDSARDAPALQIALQTSELVPPLNGRVTIRIGAAAGTTSPLVALQGWLEYDPSRMRYVGQFVDRHTIVVVNGHQAADGKLRLISVRPSGLRPSAAELAFDVLAPDALRGIRFRFEDAATQDLHELRGAEVQTRLAPLDGPPVPGSPRRMRATDWAELLAPTGGGAGLMFAVAGRAGQGLIYGDVNFDGVVNVLDVLNTSNLAVGLRPLLTDTTKDYVVAANVAPANLPGLGEPDDPIPPGRNSDGSLVINAFDVAAISNASLGKPTPIAGQPIPGRGPITNRVVVSGTITSDRTFFRDTVYELHGQVRVAIPPKLTIQAGARIEGDAATRGTLVTNSGASIDARGTRLQPIVMTCNQPAKAPGCWGGLVINGFGLLNNSDVPPSGSDVFGCPIKFGTAGTGVYGGCLAQHSAGVLRYVRLEYPGAGGSGGPIAGLSLLGNGSGTAVDSIQVHGSSGDGVFISGGSVGVRALVLTANAGAGLRWDNGWVGGGQFIAILAGAVGGPALLGSSFAGNPNASPRSAPTLYNLTLVGTAPGGGPGGGIVLQNGSAAVVRNAIVLRPGAAAGLDFQGADVCALAGGASPAVAIEHSIPDLRPTITSPAATGAATAPLDGFFTRPGEFVGAVPPSDALGTTVPWYAGWTRGWSGGP